jgi:glycosyltransferase involved in cell wall biosynthesis
MRVVQLVQKPQRRGAEVFAFQLSAWLREQEHDVRTVYLYPYEGSPSLPVLAGDTVLYADEKSRLEKVSGVHPFVLASLGRIISAVSPDIVQVNGARTIKYGAALKALVRPSWKLIYRNIDSPVFWVKDRLRKAYYQRLVMPQLDGVIGVSRKTLDEVLTFYELDVPSVFIPNGVDMKRLLPGDGRAELRRTLGAGDEDTVLLFMGNLSRQKRPDRFLRVLQRAVERAPVVGWLLGDGTDRAALEADAGKLGLGDRVRFLGYQDQVAPFIDAADVYMSTSDTEGIPAVVIEAGCLGKPTIGMRVGGMHECVVHNETGILVLPGDEPALVDACSRLASDHELRVRMGQSARSFVQQTFSMEQVGAQYLKFYEKIHYLPVQRKKSR